MRQVSLHRPLPDEAVLARSVWNLQRGHIHPLVREGVPLTGAIQSSLLRAGVASVWVHDAVSDGIDPGDPLPPVVRGRAVQTLGRMLDRIGRGDGPPRVSSVQFRDLEDVVGSILSEVQESSGVVSAIADLQSTDGYTVAHSLNVTVLGLVVGERVLRAEGWRDWRGKERHGADDTRLTKLGLGLMLHDVGKAAIPNAILSKPGRLTEAEFALIREHTRLGLEVLEGVDLSPLTRVVISDHHERLDGSGYPAGKSGDAIHVHARIAGVVDTYDAAAAGRPYQAYRTNEAAWELVMRLGREGTLDPAVCQHFSHVVAPYPPGTEVELDDGRIGVVAAVSEDDVRRPVVRLTHDPGGHPVPAEDLDLRTVTGVRIRDAVGGGVEKPDERLGEDLAAVA